MLNNTNPELSILIVNFNGKRFLNDCLIAISKQVSVSYEIILVDNCSTDGSAEYIQLNHPTIQLIRNTQNAGFAAGNNLAATHASGQYLLLLNNDTVIRTDVKPAIELIQLDPTIAVVGFSMLSSDLAPRKSIGHFPTPWRLMKFSCLLEGKASSPYLKSRGNIRYRLVDWFEGSFLLTTRRAWDDVGGLDEGYFMYVEDVDFCQSIHRRKLRVAYVPAGAYIHYGGYSSDRFGMLITGYRRYNKKFSGPLQRFATNAVLTLGLVVRVIGFSIAHAATRGAESKRKRQSCVEALLNSPW
jgi:N-acetylglucosaminyl-diphospho-decaprenol L-rhamnosyltransferase